MEKVSKSKIMREDGYLYYLGSDGYVWATPMKGKSGRKHKAGTEMVVRKPGYLYFVDKGGYVARAPQRRGGKKKKMGIKITSSTTKHVVPGKVNLASLGGKKTRGKPMAF